MKNSNNSIPTAVADFQNLKLTRKHGTIVTIVTFLINKIKYNRLTATGHVTKAVTKLLQKSTSFLKTLKSLKAVTKFNFFCNSANTYKSII